MSEKEKAAKVKIIKLREREELEPLLVGNARGALSCKRYF
jgi:hypothetical protein